MPNRVPAMARVRLARSLRRLLTLPVLLLLAGTAVVAYGWLGVVMPLAIAPIAVGVALALVGLASAAWLISVRLDVEEAAIRVRWIGGERLYPLAAGPVTRVRFRGETASKLRARTGLLGWQLGEARLRDEEQVHVVRLAPTESAILVPTEKGRLAVAPADEAELLDALTQAARARERLAEQAVPTPPVEPEAPVEPEPEPHALTGIERALLERRLAEEREGAEAEPRAVRVEPPVREPEQRTPATLAAPRRRRAIGLQRPRLRGLVRRPGARAASVALPLLAAGVAWGVGLVSGRVPDPGTDLGRLTTLALVLAGPATSVGVVMALAWWPRIVGVVLAGGLAASLFVGRALMGG